MKIVIHCIMLLLISAPTTFSQKNNNIGNLITLVNATMENQVSGANSENSSRTIYNITFHSESGFVIKKIKGKINGTSLEGKVIYSNTVSDSIMIRNGDSFTVRFEKHNIQSEPENTDSFNMPVNKKCHAQRKNNTDSSLIFLSFSLQDKPYHNKVRCSKKIISHDRRPPQ